MNATDLRLLLDDALRTLEAARDELRDLDAAIGDGDLGITVSDGARAAREGVRSLPDDATPAQTLRIIAQRFASANPSTMSALVAAGLLAGARALGDAPGLDRAGALTLLEAATAAIQARGGAQIGDKTIVDALVPTTEVLRRAQNPNDEARGVLAEMIDAARQAVTETAGLQSQRGRAAWVGERTIGHPDGGATAYLRFLQAIERAAPVRVPERENSEEAEQ
ncbi:DAK2 domain-containing protein [Solwaraspora sp. WMMD406]|uniref:DAK2 domain-containing protein n=1 Tax=Solwaraspora sp. WMMD406 TaxID=3016095 RepID=UPI0024172DE4|nr:DAK2 domain-containing protein [Solwaraspora sp. WMMD406]MDG4768000.1 DAK2 domain-containing protein [Solwaraspora sp. WMMD406]